jgi:indole-3-glycerol phosphate synthase
LLESLYAGAIEDAAARELEFSLSEVERLATEAAPAVDALQALAPRQSVHVLAEIKRASPSKGDLANIADPVLLARTYESAGASMISVLTEQRRFKGSLADLKAVEQAVNIPVLRKDFIANEYQILEARAAGADVVLLIVAGLNPKKLRSLKTLVEQLGMTAFVETHSADEVRLAVDEGSSMIGVNARDLSTFETDRDLFGRLVELIPAGTVKVAESAVRNTEDVRHYRNSGADVVLVGEALVTGDPTSLIKSFLEV